MNNNSNDPAARARVIAGAILLPIVWLASAATVVALLVVLPDRTVEAWAWLIVVAGLVVAAVGSSVVVNGVIHGDRINLD